MQLQCTVAIGCNFEVQTYEMSPVMGQHWWKQDQPDGPTLVLVLLQAFRSGNEAAAVQLADAQAVMGPVHIWCLLLLLTGVLQLQHAALGSQLLWSNPACQLLTCVRCT